MNTTPKSVKYIALGFALLTLVATPALLGLCVLIAQDKILFLIGLFFLWYIVGYLAMLLVSNVEPNNETDSFLLTVKWVAFTAMGIGVAVLFTTVVILTLTLTGFTGLKGTSPTGLLGLILMSTVVLIIWSNSYWVFESASQELYDRKLSRISV